MEEEADRILNPLPPANRQVCGLPGEREEVTCDLEQAQLSAARFPSPDGSRPAHRSAAKAAGRGSCRSPVSAMAIVGALVLPLTIAGMIEASTTRRPSRPWTRSSSSTTAMAIGGQAHLAGADRVIAGLERLADPGVDRLVALHRRVPDRSPRRDRDRAPSAPGPRAVRRTPGAHVGAILRIGHVVEADGRRLARVGRAQPDAAAAARAHQVDMHLEGMIGQRYRPCRA